MFYVGPFQGACWEYVGGPCWAHVGPSWAQSWRHNRRKLNSYCNWSMRAHKKTFCNLGASEFCLSNCVLGGRGKNFFRSCSLLLRWCSPVRIDSHIPSTDLASAIFQSSLGTLRIEIGTVGPVLHFRAEPSCKQVSPNAQRFRMEFASFMDLNCWCLACPHLFPKNRLFRPRLSKHLCASSASKRTC